MRSNHGIPRLTRLMCLAIALVGLASDAFSAPQLTLAKQGKTSYVIVVGEDAIPAERTAAAELASYLKKVTGADFPVKAPADARASASRILIGQTDEAKKLLPDVDWQSLGHDGIAINTKGRDLILAGGRNRGTLYAVYTFLGESVGCRWWTSTEEYVPNKPSLTVPAPNLTYIPKLKYREVHYGDVDRDPLFAVKLKSNGNFQKIPDEYGGHYTVLPYFCHTFNMLLPPDKYFENHPEWYSLQNGKRVVREGSDSQLCVTNADMRKELTKNVLEAIARNPDAGIISVSQNDGYGQCQCENCKAVSEREGSEAGPLIEMINEVAEAVEAKYPGFLVDTLAYHYTRKPPKHIRPKDNVLIHLAGLESDFAQPVDSQSNAAYRDDVKGWSKISKNLFIWHYLANYGNFVQPNPNIFNIGSDVRFFLDNNTVGVFAQGDDYSPIGDFVRLRAWVVSRMLWNPSLDHQKLVKEFTRGYYGPAAPHIDAYLKLSHDSAKRSRSRLHYANYDTSFLTLDDMNQATHLWDKAEAAVSANPVLLERVRRDRMTLDYAWLQNWASLKRQAQIGKRDFLGPEDVMKACDEWLAKAKKYQKTFFINAGKADYEPTFREECRKQLDLTKYGELPPEVQGLQANQYVVLQTETHEEFLMKAEVVDDPLASDGKAVLLDGPGESARWYARSYFSGRWRCYAQVRSEDAKAGASFGFVLWDHFLSPDKFLVQKEIPLKSGSGYHTYDLGLHDLRPGMFLWIRFPGEGVKALHIDRMFLVREAK